MVAVDGSECCKKAFRVYFNYIIIIAGYIHVWIKPYFQSYNSYSYHRPCERLLSL